MKYFLDSAKMDEIKYAYETFGIDGVTTNPKHIMLSGKPFMTAITDIANWVKEEGLEGYEKFPVSVEINPHLDKAEDMIAEAKKIAALSSNFVIKIPATEEGISAARKLEKEGIRTNVTLIFSPAQAILPAKNGSKFVSPFIGWKEANGEDCREYIK
ncbi:MAG: transaldolase, partial [Acetatifactor sp.]|nr:transaldolase [Acetatifactor sp.]